MVDSRFTARLASVTAFLLFGALLVSHFRDRSAFRSERTVLDSMATRLRRNAAVEATLLRAGDYLPEVKLKTADGAPISLRALPRSGLKYLYMYRKDCPPCQLLDSVLARAPAARRDSIAFIAFHPESTLVPEALPRHFSFVIDSTTRNRYFSLVPTLLVVDTSGRVVSAAQESLPLVSKLFDLYKVIHESDVDSVVARARKRLISGASGPATPAGT